MEKHVRHVPPSRREAPNNRMHHVLLTEGKKVIGYADLIYHGTPVPFFHLYDLDVSRKKQGQKNGTLLMDKVEALLLEKGKMGVVEDGIRPNSPAAGMYARRGWILIPNTTNMYAFNPPKGYDLARLSDIGTKLEDPITRGIRHYRQQKDKKKP